jgi:superfamily II DNA or RNA helicase
MLTLRPYQTDLIAQTRATIRQGARRVLVQAPTGSGKTVLVASMLAGAAARGKRAWFVVHRKELLDQAVRTFVEAADLHVGIIAAGYPADAAAPVQVCAVGSLKRRLSRVAKPDLLVWDECHHLPSASWSAVAAALPQAVHIGLTATPARLDGRGLRPFFDALLCGPSTADLIAAGWLAPYRLFAPAQFDASKLHKVAGDYNRKEVSETLARSTVVGDAVGTYRKYCMGGGDAVEPWSGHLVETGAAHPTNTPTGARALVFAWSLASSQAIADAFRFQGIAAQHVDGETPAAERADAMRLFRDGTLRVLCSVELFSEGLDVAACDAVFLLRPTASLGLYLQQCGRGLRPAAGKAAVRIFDHVNNWSRHGLPDDPRTWTLDGIEKAPGERLQPIKRCAACFAVASAARKVCPYCQAAYPVKERKVVQVAGELAETELSQLRARIHERERECATLDDFQRLGKEMGYKGQWAWMRWQHSAAKARLRQKREIAQAATDDGW